MGFADPGLDLQHRGHSPLGSAPTKKREEGPGAQLPTESLSPPKALKIGRSGPRSFEKTLRASNPSKRAENMPTRPPSASGIGSSALAWRPYVVILPFGVHMLRFQGKPCPLPIQMSGTFRMMSCSSSLCFPVLSFFCLQSRLTQRHDEKKYGSSWYMSSYSGEVLLFTSRQAPSLG